MTATVKDLIEDLDQIARKMLDKGFANPRAEAWIKSGGRFSVSTWSGAGHIHTSMGGDNLDELLLKSHEWIAEQPSPEERAKREFQKQLGALIDKGRELGIEVEHINPLAELAKALSENALTDQRGVETDHLSEAEFAERFADPQPAPEDDDPPLF